MAGGLDGRDGIEIRPLLKAWGMVDFLNIIRGHIDTDAGLTDVIPIQGMKSAPHLDFAGEIRAPRRPSRPSTPRASPMWRPRAMRSPPASSTWSA